MHKYRITAIYSEWFCCPSYHHFLENTACPSAELSTQKKKIVKRSMQLDLETAQTRWQYAFQLGYSHNEWSGWKFQPFIHSFYLLPRQFIYYSITENYLSRCMNSYVSIFITHLFKRLNLDELFWIFLLHSLMFIHLIF